MITTGSFPKALVGGAKKQKQPKPKQLSPVPKLAMMNMRKGKRGS